MNDEEVKGEPLQRSSRLNDEDGERVLPRVSYEEESLTTAKVLELFELANNPEVTICVPPVCPKGGEVYLFVPESVDTKSKKFAVSYAS